MVCLKYTCNVAVSLGLPIDNYCAQYQTLLQTHYLHLYESRNGQVHKITLWNYATFLHNSLFYIAGLCYQWLKSDVLSSDLLRSGELLLLKVHVIIMILYAENFIMTFDYPEFVSSLNADILSSSCWCTHGKHFIYSFFVHTSIVLPNIIGWMYNG